jgi:hypothetical protein
VLALLERKIETSRKRKKTPTCFQFNYVQTKIIGQSSTLLGEITVVVVGYKARCARNSFFLRHNGSVAKIAPCLGARKTLRRRHARYSFGRKLQTSI